MKRKIEQLEEEVQELIGNEVLTEENWGPVDPELIGQTYVNYGKYMYLSIDAIPWTVAHETGHIMGLRDSYIQEGHGKYRTTRPAKGKEGRMMSQVGGKVHPEEIDKLVEGIKCPCGESQEIRKNR